MWSRSNIFDLVIGFSGEGTLPEHVMNELLELMRCIATDCGTDFWEVLNMTFKHGERFLHQCPLVAVFRDNGSVRRIEIGLHEPPTRVLGAKLWCGSSVGTCHPGPGDLTPALGRRRSGRSAADVALSLDGSPSRTSVGSICCQGAGGSTGMTTPSLRTSKCCLALKATLDPMIKGSRQRRGSVACRLLKVVKS